MISYDFEEAFPKLYSAIEEGRLKGESKKSYFSRKKNALIASLKGDKWKYPALDIIEEIFGTDFVWYEDLKDGYTDEGLESLTDDIEFCIGE